MSIDVTIVNTHPEMKIKTKKVKKAPTSRKTSLYRLRDKGGSNHDDLRSYVVASYLDREGFQARTVAYDGVDGLLVTGTIAPGRTDWCDVVEALTGLPTDEENRTALSLLLIRTDKAVYGLTYGMGHLMIDQARIDPGFGIEFAVRCLNEDRITKVRRQVMDARGRTDENSATSGEHIRGFGIEQFGEIVSQISGQISGVPLTFTQDHTRAAHVTGNDRSIKIALGNTPATLLHDLREIEEVCARPSPLPVFEFIAQIRPLSPKSEQAQLLDARLDEKLGEGGAVRMALAVPSTCRDRFEQAESFKVTLAKNTQTHAELDVDMLISAVEHLPPGKRLSTLRDGRIVMFADATGNEVISSKVPADHWLTTEVEDGVVHYFYWQGRWYEVGAEYLTVIEDRIAELFAHTVSVTMPPWTKARPGDSEEHDEGWYNKRIAAQDGYVLLDKDTVHTERLRGGGLEIADALGPAGQLICVKKAKDTAPLNHLFSQGRVAVETLRNDREALEKFLAKVDELAPGHPLDRSFRTPTVVFGILLKDGVPLTPSSLFAFAKVSLLHTTTLLEGMGARVEIVSISRVTATGMDATPSAEGPGGGGTHGSE